MPDLTNNFQVSKSPRIYLAGPEIFLKNAAEVGERKKRLCLKYGFDGIYPIDAEVDLTGLSPREAALRIGRLNEERIRGCFAVIANITPFRGPSADVGTAYEMGFARSLGLVVSAYSNVSDSFRSRTTRFLGDEISLDDDNRNRDSYAMGIEDWGMSDNLMLESCIAESGGCFVTHDAPDAEKYTDLRAFEGCLRAMRNGGPVDVAGNP